MLATKERDRIKKKKKKKNRERESKWHFTSLILFDGVTVLT